VTITDVLDVIRGRVDHVLMKAETATRPRDRSAYRQAALELRRLHDDIHRAAGREHWRARD
jgi:hypothetical protein